MPIGKGQSTTELDTIALGLAILSAKPNPYGQYRTFEEIAAYCQCSKERIRQIETQALKKLRKRIPKAELIDLLESIASLSRQSVEAKEKKLPVY